jgi:VWFA-related protein
MKLKKPLCFLLFAFVFSICFSQEPTERKKQKVRVVTIPIKIFTKKERKEGRLEEMIEAGEIIVKENGVQQTLLSIRSVNESPLSLAILIQDDLSSAVNLELEELARFIENLPRNSRVMVAYIRGGVLVVRQKFTDDLKKASKALRVLSGSSFPSIGNTYEAVGDALKKFDALPAGRRAMLLISDGLDSSVVSFSLQNIELDRAISKAQQKGIAVYSFYATSNLSDRVDRRVVLIAQSFLEKLSKETGGKAFFSGTSAPVSFKPFFRELGMMLERQFLLTYLSENMKKGFYHIEVESTNPEITIQYPKGYYYKK